MARASLVLLSIASMLVAIASAEPDFAFEPSLDYVPGIDFLGWGFDANYRDTFFALKPQLFKFSFNDNPRGSEKTYRYPLDTKIFAVPDQVFIRTVGKTVTDSWVFTTDFTRRQTIDLGLGLQVESHKPGQQNIDFALAFAFNMVIEDDNTHRIVQTLAEMELWQLYLGKRILRDEIVEAMDELKGNVYKVDPQSFQLFISQYGSHFVDSVTVGGSVGQKTIVDISKHSQNFDITVAINLKFQDLTGSKPNVNLDLNFKYSEMTSTTTTETTSTATIYGGNAQFTDFVLKAGDPDAAKLLYDSWKSTLFDNPVGVRYRLVEIWTLFKDESLRKEVCTAIATDILQNKKASTYCAGAPKLIGGYERTGLEPFLKPLGGLGLA